MAKSFNLSIEIKSKFSITYCFFCSFTFHIDSLLISKSFNICHFFFLLLYYCPFFFFCVCSHKIHHFLFVCLYLFCIFNHHHHLSFFFVVVKQTFSFRLLGINPRIWNRKKIYTNFTYICRSGHLVFFSYFMNKFCRLQIRNFEIFFSFFSFLCITKISNGMFTNRPKKK